MIDPHIHILPKIDDGPSSMEKAIQMAMIAVKDGIHTMIATPHCYNGVYSNSKNSIVSACEQFNYVLKDQNIDLVVLPGCEAHLSLEILEELEKNNLLTLNNNGRYLSVELPDQFLPDVTVDFINRLCNSGLVPIITHPERNPLIQRDVEMLRDLISAGAISQITAGSITGHFGKQVMKLSKRILKMGLVNLIATDAHSTTMRPPILSAAVKKLSLILDDEECDRIFNKNPEKVIRGEMI